MKKIVLFGGSFDPPHVGHLTMAQLTLEETGADEVWFLPSPLPPHKIHSALDEYAKRVKMVEALVEGCPGLLVSVIEGDLPTPSYTVETVRACMRSFPQYQFSFLLGADSLSQLVTWKESQQLSKLITFIVVARTGFPLDSTLAAAQSTLPALQTEIVEMPILDVSSTWIRKRVELGQSVCGLVPAAVLACLQHHP